MNKKIKRIKLLKDYHAYNGFDVEIRAGAVSYPEEALQPSTFTFMTIDRKYKSFHIEYLKLHPEWFEIEYEPEDRIKNLSLDVKIKYNSNLFNKEERTESLIRCIRNFLNVDLIRLEVTEYPND